MFAYGALVAGAASTFSRTPNAKGFIADLQGFRRVWGVATDNRLNLPGAKYYLDRSSGEKPPVYVTFLDIARDDGAAVNGVCLPASAESLRATDDRERSYRRVDVSDLVEGAPGRVWAYEGAEPARTRLADGLRTQTAVITVEYLAMVDNAFRRLGEDEYAKFRASTEFDRLPVRELERVDLPQEEGPAIPSPRRPPRLG